MAKTQQTLLAEELLILKAIREYKRFSLEVDCSIAHIHKDKYGIVDFITMDFTLDHAIPEFTCYEIKVTEQDFNSKNGHNLYGDYNYYVIPSTLYKKLKSKEKYNYLFDTNRFNTTGIYTFTDKQLRKVKEAYKTDIYRKFNFEERMKVIDSMLLKWTTGSMQKYIDRYGIELRNNIKSDMI